MKIKLNLIPPGKKEEIKKIKNFRLVLKWELELSAAIVVFLLILFSINYILQINLSMAENNIGENQKNGNQVKEIEKYDAEFEESNAKVLGLSNLQSGQLNWYNFFQKLNADIPEAVEIGNIATKNYMVLLAGKAKNRETLIALRDNLEKDDCLANVNLPLSDLVAKENVEFQFDFNIKKDCLNK